MSRPPKETPTQSETEGNTPKSVKGERIAKVLARVGIASRREVERMIADGRVSVNGKVIKSPALNVLPGAKILFDGKPVAEPEPPRLWRYNKKRGLVTTERDPQGRPTVFSAMPDAMPRVMSVGRLDINTEGLLLMTNDGGLKRFLELPETGWLRRYRVRAYGRPDMARLDEIRKGVVVDKIVYREVDLEVERQQGDNFWLTVALREGKNREIKKLLDYAGLKVNRLIRLSFGPFQLGNLDDGLVEEVPRRVLRQQLGGAWTDLLEGREPSQLKKSKEKTKEKPKSKFKNVSQNTSKNNTSKNNASKASPIAKRTDGNAPNTKRETKWSAKSFKAGSSQNKAGSRPFAKKETQSGSKPGVEKSHLAPWNMTGKGKR